MADSFSDLLVGNERYRSTFTPDPDNQRPSPTFVILTCMDSRLDPLAIFGLGTGEALVIRNAGARVDATTLRSMVMAVDLLGVRAIAVLHHTQCAMCSADPAELAQHVETTTGVTPSMDLGAFSDHVEVLRSDIETLRACDLLPDDFSLAIGGFMYAVETGTVTQVV
jgi:carbonic anhydrase